MGFGMIACLQHSVKRYPAAAADNVQNGGVVTPLEELEEGELPSLENAETECEDGELVGEKAVVEEGEIVGENVEKEGNISSRWNVGMLQDKSSSSGKHEKVEFGSWREEVERFKSEEGEFGSWSNEIETGEFIPDRWDRREMPKDNYSHSKLRRCDTGKENSWKFEHNYAIPCGKYPSDDIYRRRDFNQRGSQHSRSSSRWESKQDRTIRHGSQIENSIGNNEYDNANSYRKEYNRLKRHGTDSDSNERKPYGDFGDYPCSRSRRLSSSDKYTPRYHESSLSSSRVILRYYDHHDRSPVRHERSPNARPHIREKSPYALKRSSYVGEKSLYNRSRHSDHRNQTPVTAERSPQEQVHLCDRTPSYLERSPLDRCSRYSHAKESSKKSGTRENRNPNLSSDHGGLPPSMEEDMDICDTPPHVPNLNPSIGKWCYLDYFGLECGPSKLCEIKAFVEEGTLATDHFIKHLATNGWVTVENAVSPLLARNFQSVTSDTITHLVSPPEAPSNLLSESVETQNIFSVEDGRTASESLENLHIDKRVGDLLKDYAVISGKELETISDALQIEFDHSQWEEWANYEGFILHQAHRSEELPRNIDVKSMDKNYGFVRNDYGDWFSGHLPCKGGDWKGIDEAAQDGPSRKKLVLNDNFPTCLMPKSGCADPRLHLKDDLYRPSQSKTLHLPPWSFSCSDDPSDCSSKGTMFPVVRINARVAKDHRSFISEPRINARVAKDHDSQPKVSHEKIPQGSWKSIESINTPKDRLCSVSDLQLDLGHWYYLAGSGHEQGPFSFAQLQVLVNQGVIQKGSSVFRKHDKVWVSVTSVAETSEAAGRIEQQRNAPTDYDSRPVSQSHAAAFSESNKTSSFHSLHPQFIGFTRGKLHELVMKSFKTRELALTVNQILDPWIDAKQRKKEIEKHTFRKSEGDPRSGNRARFLVDGSEEEYETGEVLASCKDESSFEDLYDNSIFHGEQSASPETDMRNWGLLGGRTLARVFHFLRSDLKSLSFASSTCKQWRYAVKIYKDISRQVDLSSVGPKCSDSFLRDIMNCYNKQKITSMVLVGCTSITPGTLEDILHSFPCISTIDVRRCIHFGDLALKFPNVNWLKDRSSHSSKIYEDSHSKIRSLKQKTDKTSLVSKGNAIDDLDELKDYFDSVNKRDSANQEFRQSIYKRSKLFDARKSSSILSRDARMRRWAINKSENGYKRMEEFFASSLKDIMKENTFEFFVPKVAEIEAKMKSGYYIGHGLNLVKQDISRMCRDAIKAKKQGIVGDMNHIITLFIHLGMLLEEGSKASYYGSQEMFKSWKDGCTGLKYKKKLSTISEMKPVTRNANGGLDFGEYVSDGEIRKTLSKLNKKSLNSGSETSDGLNRSSEDGYRDSYEVLANTSDIESDLDFPRSQSANSKRDEYFDSMTEEREWGARMTKTSLVPPVTRKYEVIDHYVAIADEKEVHRKMRVTLPEDYAEKFNAQKNGTEDMELPEVKDYKSRKLLGDEVIEQEVYGIDPYTHNLLLDSMPEELNWLLTEKQLFIEEKLLCSLNKQVRPLTGTENTPMKYPLQRVVEELERYAKNECDIRTMKMCRGILKSIDRRPNDSYVAYRKGLGVVCNKKGGFGEDDFVIEFLGEVYPVWKWFEKQDGIKYLQKNSDDPAPEFYNIYLERPKGDAEGYDLVVVDAMHKANFASRICHSCRPNCEAKVTAVNGQYQIGIYTVRGIQYGEELTFDYNSVTESNEEYEASVCLCGSEVCRGSYLNLTGEGAFQEVLKKWHGILDRHQLLVEACELNSVSEEDYLDLGRAGLGSCLLGGLPDWVVAYSAHLVRFINFERTKLPEEILKHNLEEKRKYFSDICLEVEKSDAEVQAEGVYNQRLQNLAVTLDKVRYVMRRVFDDPKKSPPPLEKLSPEEAVSYIWNGNGSLVEQLLQCMSPHVGNIKSNIPAHDPSHSDDLQRELQKSLLWLRDELRNLPCTYKCRHDAAADLIHMYAYTKCFFRVKEYKSVTSPPVYISPLDLGPKCADKLGPGLHEYSKTYGENYCLEQLIFWYNQTNTEQDCSLARASRGCLSLPDIGSFYSKIQKPSRVYGPKTVKFMLTRMEKQPQRPWPKDQLWSFEETSRKVFGSPMFDAVLHKSPLDKEMVHWLKNRPAVFHAPCDK